MNKNEERKFLQNQGYDPDMYQECLQINNDTYTLIMPGLTEEEFLILADNYFTKNVKTMCRSPALQSLMSNPMSSPLENESSSSKGGPTGESIEEGSINGGVAEEISSEEDEMIDPIEDIKIRLKSILPIEN